MVNHSKEQPKRPLFPFKLFQYTLMHEREFKKYLF